MAARRNVSNLIRAEVRRKNREQKFVELSDLRRTVEVPADVGNAIQGEKLTARKIEQLLGLLKEPMDKNILQLKLTGERRTAEFAKAMQIGHLTTCAWRIDTYAARGV